MAYVVDGSVRRSGTELRIAARLMRADTGFVVWSQTYDRPLAELPAVQDDHDWRCWCAGRRARREMTRCA